MSDSDILALRLFIGSLSAAALASGMSAAGWNQKWFVRGMFGLAVALAALAIFWRKLPAVMFPGSSVLATVVSTRSGWFGAGILLGGPVTLLAIRLLRRRKFKLSINSEEHGVVRGQLGDERGDVATFMIQLDALADVDRCIAHVTDIQKKYPATARQQKVDFPHDLVLRNTFSILKGERSTIDCLQCLASDNRLRPIFYYPFHIENALREPGLYIYTIRVSGGGYREFIRVEVTWEGKWDTLSARLL